MRLKQKNKGFKAVFYREWLRMATHPIYLIILVAIPLGSCLFFVTLMPEGLPEKLPIGIIDHDNSMISRNTIRQIDATAQNRIVGYYLNFSEARSDMQQGKIYGFIEIPVDFEKDIILGNQPKVWFYYNQSFFIAGSLTLKNLSRILATISGGVNLQSRLAHGQTEKSSIAQIQAIVPDIHPIGNPHINYSVYLTDIILPGILELIVLLTSVYIVGIELKQKTSRKWLAIADNSLFKALLGKFLPYTISFVIIGLFYNVVLFKFLQYPLNTSFLWMLLNTGLMIVASQCVGILMIGIFPVLRDGLSFASLYGVLAFSFSGFSFPIEGMHPLLQGLSVLFPLRYHFKIYQTLALNGFGWQYVAFDFVSLVLFLSLPFLICIRLKKAMIFQCYPKK